MEQENESLRDEVKRKSKKLDEYSASSETLKEMLSTCGKDLTTAKAEIVQLTSDMARLQESSERSDSTWKEEFSMLKNRLEEELKVGREEHAKILAQFGVYRDKELQGYVDLVGQRVAKVSSRPELENEHDDAVAVHLLAS